MSKKIKKIKYGVSGMRCKSCESVIGDRLATVVGVKNARVDLDSGTLEVELSVNITKHELQELIEDGGYKLYDWDEKKEAISRYKKIGLSFFLVVGVYYALYSFDFFPSFSNLSSDIHIGAAFAFGLAAAFSSCATTSGAMLLALDNGVMGEMSKLKTNLLFNVGRIASYGFFGGVLGFMGGVFGFSTNISLVITIVLSLALVVLGLRMLKINIFGWNFELGSRDLLNSLIGNVSGSYPSVTAFASGVSTFFLPCGFTQALQLYVIGRGDLWEGAALMLVFALGTLPGLLAIGLISKFLSFRFKQFVFYFSGMAILVVGILNIGGAMNALGFAPSLAFVSGIFSDAEDLDSVPVSDSNIRWDGDEQVAKMKVVGLDYYPSKFYVQVDKKVRWIIDGSNAKGCGKIITSPQLGITKMVPKDRPLQITFVPKRVGPINFSCTMGMTTPGASFVVR